MTLPLTPAPVGLMRVCAPATLTAAAKPQASTMLSV
jgi:hypothetical protein